MKKNDSNVSKEKQKGRNKSAGEQKPESRLVSLLRAYEGQRVIISIPIGEEQADEN